MAYTIKEIIDYVLESPENTNPAILKQMILNMTSATLPEQGDTTPVEEEGVK